MKKEHRQGSMGRAWYWRINAVAGQFYRHAVLQKSCGRKKMLPSCQKTNFRLYARVRRVSRKGPGYHLKKNSRRNFVRNVLVLLLLNIIFFCTRVNKHKHKHKHKHNLYSHFICVHFMPRFRLPRP